MMMRGCWWTGTAGDEYYRSPYPALLAMPDFTTARYITVEIDDTTNPDGYVQIGRLFAGGCGIGMAIATGDQPALGAISIGAIAARMPRERLPELADVAAPAIHEPWNLPGGPPGGYPLPIVEHGAERAEALRRYEAIR